MYFSEFVQRLQQQFQKPLPGHDNVLKKHKEERNFTNIQPSEKTRKSAVLILFYPFQNEIYTALILRPPYDGTHGGQMAFPGGQVEEADESLVRTALREAQEEIGIKPRDVVIVGELTKIFIPPSNFWVTPVVGFLRKRPEFYPDPFEVQEIVEIKWNDFLEPTNMKIREMNVRGYTFETEGFEVENQWVWGASALMITELLDMFRCAE
jgi:8-oxo-dGTP pyrophosphatase MutT (NUDIX family)